MRAMAAAALLRWAPEHAQVSKQLRADRYGRGSDRARFAAPAAPQRIFVTITVS
jgi:hypothetical protein